jgi:large subunit ribosomal protein L10
MPTQKKIDTVADLTERLGRATLLASAEYRGLRVKEMVELRRRLREGGIEVKVIKNTLLKLAADEAGQAELMGIVEGPTALALSYGDVIDAAKALAAYAQGAPTAFAIRGGFMDGAVLSAQDLRDLVRIPPKPVLLAQFMGQMQSPLAGFVGLMDAPLRELVGLMQALLSELPGLIEARAAQLEASGAGVEPAAAKEPPEEEQGAEPETTAEAAAEEQETETETTEEASAEEQGAETEPTAEAAAEEQGSETEPTAEASAEEQGTETETTEEGTEPEPTTEESEKEESSG